MSSEALKEMTDLERIERIPLAARRIPGSTYAALQEGAQIDPGKTALIYFRNGDCHDPERLPWQSRLTHWGLSSLLGKSFAEPYRTVSFEELFAKINQTANLLHALGVGKDDVVSVLMPNVPETVYTLFAAEAAGIVNPINPFLEPDIIKSIMTAAGSKVLVTLGPVPGTDIWAKVQRIRDQVPSLRQVLVVHGRSDRRRGTLSYHEAIANCRRDRLDSGRIISLEDSASMFHTGGTTGIPKLVLRTHGNEIYNAMMLDLAVPLTREDVGLLGLPLFHVNAAVGSLLTALPRGRTVLMAGPAGFRTPGVRDQLFKIIQRHRVAYFAAVPTVFSALAQVPAVQEDLSSMKFAVSASAPLPVEVFKTFERKTGIRILEGYGLTEATVVNSLNPYAGQSKIGSVGRRVPYAEMKPVILDDAGGYLRDCSTDEIGTIVVRGPHVGLGYTMPAHNQRLWVEDSEGRRWLNTGDLGRQDRDGYFWLTGRAKELIIRGGHNIDPKLIEEPFYQHPAVAEAAAVGRPDAYAGELPVVYLSLKRGCEASTEELLDFVRTRIPERAAIPKALYILPELPTTAIGKIFKPQLVWWETERVLQSEIASLGTEIRSASVKVDKDELHGSVARVAVKCGSKQSTDGLRARLETLLARYKVHWQLEFV
jgi:fatty-acyl-CoA synthase